jgi:alpha-ketoglutarate-dependent taurine dioxygenase
MNSPSPSLTSPLDLDRQPGRPPVLHCAPTGDPAGWVAAHRDALRAALPEHGALLVRGLGLSDAGDAAAVFGLLATELMTETEAFAPRTVLAPGVYSATTWPPNQPMCMHHELSYTLRPPGLLLVACLTAPADGGATGLADAGAVVQALPPDLVGRFAREGWQLVRNYNDEIGASWEEAFGTADRREVQSWCAGHGIQAEWQPDGGLRTRQRRPAVVRHPVTGRRTWFNQVAFLNEWTLAPEVREYLVDVYGEDGLPFTTRHGNGDPVGEDVVQLLNQVYEAATIRQPWQDGDLLLVDNIGTAHSRESYSGDRQVVVGLADPVGPDELSPRGAR